jgi:hypothetical protein
MRKLILVIILAFVAVIPTSGKAQEATPPAEGCTVAPREQEDVVRLMALSSTPADPVSFATVRLPDGDPVDEETITQLQEVLDQADACARAFDALRFLALYSDDFIVHRIFGPEAEGIETGQPPSDQSDTPNSPDGPQVNLIDDARLLEDGRIAAHVFVTGSTDFGTIVWFVQRDGNWVIDDIRQSADPPSGTKTVPEGAQGLVNQAIDNAADELGLAPGEITLVSIKPVNWPDTALGCPEDGGVYAAVVTPGYRIVLAGGDTTITYHTDLTGTVVSC